MDKTTPLEEETISAFGKRLTKEVGIRLFLSEDPRGGELQEFCRRLSEMAPNIRTVEVADEAGPLPAILIGERLRYCGVPAGNEIKPFLEAIAFLDETSIPALDPLPDGFMALETPADLQVFVTPFCNFCPAVVRRLLPLPFLVASIYLTVIDATLFPEIAAERNIKSAPTLVLDDHLRWTGRGDMEELARAVVNRDPAMLGNETLGRILQTEGGAYELAGMMHRHEKIFPAFADLLTDERFTVRLAAMVTVEDLLERDGDLALQVVQPMLKRYSQVADAVKGDFLYLLGEIKSAEALPLLQAASADPNAEIREAAAEALEKIDTDQPIG